MNFENYKFRASAIHKLITPPKDAEAKKNGDLGATAKTYLKELYIEAVWGISRDIQTAAMDKGKLTEPDSLTILSRLDKELYIKNTERVTNDFFSGEPDIYKGESIRNAKYIIDAKSSFSPWTFIAVLGEKLNPEYKTQLNIYLDLCNCEEGEVSYCLNNTPKHIVDDMKRRMMYEMNAGVSIDTINDNPEYLAACEEIELSNKFDHIPIHQRRIKFPVKRDQELIDLAKQKVERGREYLQYLYDTHYLQKQIA
jgi:hypothetical protein